MLKYNALPSLSLSHLRIGLPPKGWGELHVAPLRLADVVGCGINLGCHVQHINAIFCDN